ncbi:hypothetical protein [Robbsia sp. KACC 23696]|uniref:hypothetical protein n=1 Tax=Robbsia sp. KACC 23696 TaxID=3149231 RepID=UPI00325ADA63
MSFALSGAAVRRRAVKAVRSALRTPIRRTAPLAVAVILAGISFATISPPALAQTPEVKETLPNAGASRDNAAQAAFLNIVSVASTRLSLAQTFAGWAWQQQQAGKSPGDVQRDDETEQGTIKMAPHFGLPADFANAVILDQTRASEQLQTQLFADWKQSGGAPRVDDSAYQGARGTLYQLSQSLLGALTQVQSLRDRGDCPMMLSQAITHWTTQMATLSSEQRKALPTALAHVCRGGVGGTA